MGYLICDKCGGFYELQIGESPEDFDLTCNCGGELKFYKSIDDEYIENNDGKSYAEQKSSQYNNIFIIGLIAFFIGLIGYYINPSFFFALIIGGVLSYIGYKGDKSSKKNSHSDHGKKRVHKNKDCFMPVLPGFGWKKF